jgi:hypothetical protein
MLGDVSLYDLIVQYSRDTFFCMQKKYSSDTKEITENGFLEKNFFKSSLI